ncbi:MAG: metal ABC transporter substrate-binding protein [Chloroflexota bacterium]|nr:MAG: metal ABC transporter substrate-binding protein [Chloroflexota bacterium]
MPRHSTFRSRWPVILLMLVALAACGGAPGSPGPSGGDEGRIQVVTTSSVFADMARNVGGDRVAVTSLVPKGLDIHTYQVTPADLRAVATADLFVMNGLGLDDWLEKTIRSAGNRAPILKLAVDLPGVVLLPGDTPDTQNPHLWMDVSNGIAYATRIATALEAADPTAAADIAASADAYAKRLSDLDAWVRDRIATIPEADRRFVLFHDALPYFARAYGLTIVGVAVEAPGQDPSAGEIAALIDRIKATGVKAIFSEAQFPTALVDQIARETGARVVANLYDDTLGDDPVTSYEALIRWDVDQLVGALR